MATLVLESNMNKEEAVKEIKLGFYNNINEKIAKVITGYRGDLEEVFKEAIDKEDIEKYGKYYSNLIVKGCDADFRTTNQLQRDCIIEYGVYLLTIYMIDTQAFLPESIIDDQLMIRINNAADALGFSPIYQMQLDEKGNIVINNDKKCVNVNYKYDFVSNEEDVKDKDSFMKQVEDINKYFADKGDNTKIVITPEPAASVTEEAKTETTPTASTEEKKPEEPKAKKSPRKTDETKQEVAVVTEPAYVKPEPAATPVQTIATQQVYTAYNPITGEPAHTGPVPTEYGPAPVASEPAATPATPAPSNLADAKPVEEKKPELDFDLGEFLMQKFGEERIKKLEAAAKNTTVSEDQIVKTLESGLVDIFDQIESLIVDGDNQKEGAKSDKKKSPRTKK